MRPSRLEVDPDERRHIFHDVFGHGDALDDSLALRLYKQAYQAGARRATAAAVELAGWNARAR